MSRKVVNPNYSQLPDQQPRKDWNPCQWPGCSNPTPIPGHYCLDHAHRMARGDVPPIPAPTFERSPEWRT